jgi:hypothetical protein
VGGFDGRKRFAAREIHRLTALAISKKKTPGTYADGGGPWLQVIEAG